MHAENLNELLQPASSNLKITQFLGVPHIGNGKLQKFKRSLYRSYLVLLQPFRSKNAFKSIMCDTQEFLLKDPKFDKILLKQSRT